MCHLEKSLDPLPKLEESDVESDDESLASQGPTYNSGGDGINDFWSKDLLPLSNPVNNPSGSLARDDPSVDLLNLTPNPIFASPTSPSSIILEEA